MEVPERFPLARELAAFEAHRAGLMECAAGKYALVHGDELAGEYDTEQEAVAEGFARFGHVPFLVKQIVPFDVPRPLGFYVGTA